jgi:hypothetical protein
MQKMQNVDSYSTHKSVYQRAQSQIDHISDRNEIDQSIRPSQSVKYSTYLYDMIYSWVENIISVMVRAVQVWYNIISFQAQAAVS